MGHCVYQCSVFRVLRVLMCTWTPVYGTLCLYMGHCVCMIPLEVSLYSTLIWNIKESIKPREVLHFSTFSVFFSA
jgi:hypothetical protein